MTASFFLPRPRIVDANGTPISGARVLFYNAGTTTPKNVYSDQALTTPISQPVTADSGGKLPMIYFGTGLYKVRITDASDVLLDETDNVDPGLGAVAAALPISAGGTGATSAAGARANLDVPSQAELDAIALEFSELESEVNEQITQAAATIGTPPPQRLVVTATSDTACTVTADEVVVTNGTTLLRLTGVSVGAAITAAGVNGLDTGSEAISEWYHVYVIHNPTTPTTACVLSTSAGSPSLPAGYTYWRRVGAIRNNSASNLYRTRQVGSVASFIYGTNPSSALNIASGNNGGSNITVIDSNFAPDTAVGVFGKLIGDGGTLGATASVGNNSSMSSASFTATDNDGDKLAGINFTIYPSGSTIYYAASNASGSSVVALGWIDAI